MRFETNDDENRDMIRERYSSCQYYREINKFTSLPGSRNDHNFFGGTGGYQVLRALRVSLPHRKMNFMSSK
jgi:hypothetical protein